MQWHTGYLAANGGAIWMLGMRQNGLCMMCGTAGSRGVIPAPPRFVVHQIRQPKYTRGAVTGIPIPRDYISFLFPSHSPRNHFSRPRRPAAAAGPADTETKYEYQMNTEFEYLGQNVTFYLVFKFWK